MFRNLLSDQNVLSCIYRCAIVVNGGCYCCVACVFGWKSVKDIQRQGEGDGGSIVKVLQYVLGRAELGCSGISPNKEALSFPFSIQ